MDVLSSQQRSFNMSRIRDKNTKPEMLIRKFLWANGYRYRLHCKKMPGKPDIVLSKFKAIIFIHGCFWHQHGCKYTVMPTTRREFWEEKLNTNKQRDKRVYQELKEAGWRVLVIWECALRTKKAKQCSLFQGIVSWLHSETLFSEYPSSPNNKTE